MRLSFTTDQGNGALAAFGLIVLQADETLENEFRRIFVDPDVACYHARIPSHPQVTPATLSRMAADLPRTAGLLPAGVAFDAIAYACTSGATVIGQEAVAAAIHASHPDVPVTDPITAVMAACRALRASRLGFLTPYPPWNICAAAGCRKAVARGRSGCVATFLANRGAHCGSG